MRLPSVIPIAARPPSITLLACACLVMAGCSQSMLQTGSVDSPSSIRTGSVKPMPQPQHVRAPSQAAPSYAWNGNPGRPSYGPSYGHGAPSGPQPAAPGPAAAPGTTPYPAAQQARPYQTAPQTVWHATARAPERNPFPASPGGGVPATVTVQPGDTLYAISRRHGTSVTSVVDANRLGSIDVHPGQQLILPAGAR